MTSVADKLLALLEDVSDYPRGVADLLTGLQSFCRSKTGKPNWWSSGNDVFFFEWPETSSNSGEVYQVVGASSKFYGKYEISPEGRILSFPGLPESEIQRINSKGR